MRAIGPIEFGLCWMTSRFKPLFPLGYFIPRRGKAKMPRAFGPMRRHGQAGILRPILRGYGVEDQQDHVSHAIEDMPPLHPGDFGEAERGAVEFVSQIKVFRVKRGFENCGKGGRIR